MFGIGKTIARVFGTKSDRDLKKIIPLVAEINEEWSKLCVPEVSDDKLRQYTHKLQEYISETLKVIDDQIESLRAKADTDESIDVYQKEIYFTEIDKLEVQRNKRLEEVLLEILPQAFAVVKETARRFKENKRLQVAATDWDIELAVYKKNVVITGSTATWENVWDVMGNPTAWEMVHYDVQLIGGIVLHQGKISEMATGEGKTLVATLPAFLNALAKRGVHIVTVNDYLAKRDCQWMAPLFEFHGLKIDCIDRHEPNSSERRNAYLADITYGTNNEFGFDYLRDNMARDHEDMVQRKHHYAMVDEVDSVLIDDARTPLIISGPITTGSDEQEYYDLKPRIERLVREQNKIVQDFLNEAKKKIKDGSDQEGGLSLFRAHRGLPAYKPLIKFLGESGMKVLMQKIENNYIQDNARLMPEADKPLFFTIDEKNNQIELTEKGIDYLTGNSDDKHFFVLPDIGSGIAEIENDKSLSQEEKLFKTDKLISDYSVKAQRVHVINQLLRAYTLFEKEKEYIILDGKVKIVDEQTGRVMEGRRYSDGLHQALEAKENVKVEEATQTYATVTLQNYFRMYHKLAGMTGTAETEAGEFWEIYKLDVTVIPTNVKTTRQDRDDMVFKTVREKFNAVIAEIETLTKQGRPVLVGTTSVEISELLSRTLSFRKIKHQVLNAKQHQREAEVIAEAGKPGTITIATNMAGRGTDIKLTPESKAAGGLAIIGTERHESRRVDRQLRGRSGRQGDPGTSQFFVSLEDNLLLLFGSDRIAKIMDRMGLTEGEVIQHPWITKSIERAQKKVEENNFGVRKNLLEYDDVMNAQREIIYKRRRNALFGDRLEIDILNTLFDTCEDIVANNQLKYNFENFRMAVLSTLNMDSPFDEEHFEKGNPQVLSEELYQAALLHYQSKNQRLLKIAMPIIERVYRERGNEKFEGIVLPIQDGDVQIGVVTNLEKTVATKGRELIKSIEKTLTLTIIDQEWKEHLREMDELRQSVRMAVHEQKDPLLVYKFEAFGIFKSFVAKVNRDTIAFLMRAMLPEDKANVKEAPKERRQPKQKLKENKAEVQSILGNSVFSDEETPENNTKTKSAPVKSTKTINRNEKVTVKYNDGTIKKDVKYKTIEDDLANNRCVII